MANLKDIREVPELESLSGTEKVLVNVDGEAKQAPVSLIKPKVTKELMYEWNFSAEDLVLIIEENVTEDISWLANPSENEEYEIVISSYGRYWDEENNAIAIPEIVIISSSVDSVETGFCEGIPDTPNITTCISVYSGDFYDSVHDIEQGVSCSLYIYPGYHYNDENNWIAVNKGGLIWIESWEDIPLKSVQIYKITR